MSTSQVVLITGSSTGFGRTAAETLAGRGYTVFASMRDSRGRNLPHRDALESMASRNGWDLHVVDLDVTDDASVEQGVAEVLGRAGRVDVVINNAGIAALGVTEAYTAEQFQRLFEINVFGVVRVNRAVLPAMRKQGRGLLIHVSSAAARVAIPYMAAYCASKAALEAVADAYRFELSPFGVDSLVVEPGTHRTPILENFSSPADQARVAEYGAAGEYAGRIKSVFDAASRSPETPDSAAVVDAFVRLIETPPGERPFRTIPTASVKPLLEPYNAAAAGMRSVTAQIFNVPELLVLQHPASAAE